MSGIGKRSLAAAVVLGSAALFTGLGVTLSAADGAPPDLSDLRDAVRAASRRGDNVGEIAKAVDALERALAKNWTAPKPGSAAPAPAELTALRAAVEAAGRKGENVEGIRAALEEVEKAVTGQVLARPKPPAPADPPARPNPNPRRFPEPFPLPDFRGGAGGINPEDLQKAQDLMRKAIEMRLKDANDADALKLLEEAREMMLKALAGGGGRLVLPEFPFPDLNPPDPAGRAPGKFRLGVRLEKPAAILVEQLGLEKNRGVALTEVIGGSPAEKAGFRANDIVLEFAGKPVTDAPEDFTRMVNEAKAGEKLSAVVLRKGKRVELKGIELGDPRPAPRPLPALPGPKID